MKICQINCIYGQGSTGKIVGDLHNTIKDCGFESIVITPKTSIKDDKVFVVSNKLLNCVSAIYKRVFARQYDGAFIQTNRIIRILKREKPDIVHLHCINGNNINIYRLYNYLSCNKIKTVLTLHAEFPYTGGCGHAYDCEKWKTGCGGCPILKEATQSVLFDGTKRTWKKMKREFEKFDEDRFLLTAVSPWLKSRAEQSPFLNRFEIYTVLNGLDTNVFNPNNDDNVIREKLGIKASEKMIFHATASFNPYEDNLKGGKYIIELAKKLKDERVKIVVAANYGNVSDLPENIVYVGRISSQDELKQYYSAADLTVVVSKRETFSMVTAESLCCATPVVGYFAGGPESVAIDQYCEFCEYANSDELLKLIKKWINKKNELNWDIKQIQDKYSKESMTKAYMNVYDILTEKGGVN